MRQERRGVQSARGARLLALSRFSISCSKLSKATSLSSREISGSEERIASIDSFIRSASLGPPKRAFSASALMVWVGGAALGSVAEAEEFSTLHFRRVAIFGSIFVLFVVCEAVNRI